MSSTTINNFHISDGLFVSTKEPPTVSGMLCVILSNNVSVTVKMFFDELTSEIVDVPKVRLRIKVRSFTDMDANILDATNSLNIINQNMAGIESVMVAAYNAGILK